MNLQQLTEQLDEQDEDVNPSTEATPATPKYGWRPSLVTWLVVILALSGTGVFLYPTVASWFSSLNQAKIVDNYAVALEQTNPSASEQLAQARQYNDALSAGVSLEANARIPTGTGQSSDQSLDYNSILKANDSGLMGRVRIDRINVDLPIYHGTSDETLLKGAGHLEGSHLPVGGAGTHSVVTAHRGLANSTMFDALDQLQEGDRFTMEIFGEVLTYEIRASKVVEPHETDTLRPDQDLDLATLITCTPLGINSHRILVTGERVTPTPIEDISKAGNESELPGFPWWIVILGSVFVAVAIYLWRTGYTDARIRARKQAQTGTLDR